MSAEVAEAIRQTRRTLTDKVWVPHAPDAHYGETCLLHAMPSGSRGPVTEACNSVGANNVVQWNDRQTDVGAVLGMTLEALITELCKGVA